MGADALQVIPGYHADMNQERFLLARFVAIARDLAGDLSAELAEHHHVWLTILRMEFHPGALEVLDSVRDAVFKDLVFFLADRVTELGEATIGLPVGEEAT